MVWLAWVLGALVVLVVAAAFVQITSTKLANTPRPAFFDVEEAVTYVGAELPVEVAGRLSYDDVRLLVRWQLTYLRERGIATYGGVDRIAERAARAGVVVVADEDEAVDELLDRARQEGLDYDAVDIVCVLELVNDYLAGIGAVAAAVDLTRAIGTGDEGAETPRELPSPDPDDVL